MQLLLLHGHLKVKFENFGIKLNIIYTVQYPKLNQSKKSFFTLKKAHLNQDFKQTQKLKQFHKLKLFFS